MNKTILVPDINIELACISIQQKQKRATTAMVLSKIIEASQNRESLLTKDLSSKIMKELNISSELYRRSVHLLYKMELVKKVGVSIQLTKLTKDCKQITIKQL